MLKRATSEELQAELEEKYPEGEPNKNTDPGRWSQFWEDLKAASAAGWDATKHSSGSAYESTKNWLGGAWDSTKNWFSNWGKK